MFRVEFYCPESKVEAVKNAMFEAGAGKIGNYDCCCWQTLGLGQFRALHGSKPALGKQNMLHHEPELKVEIVCLENYVKPVLKALINAHPYETPAYGVIPLMTLENF